jgi:hypothetical protein
MLALGQLKREADLLCVRDAHALAKLPEAERKAWRALWADVDDPFRGIETGRSSPR